SGGESKRSQTDNMTRKWGLGAAESDDAIVDAVREVAEARGVSMAQVALAWVAAHPQVTAPIVGASKPHHLDDAIAAMDLTLSEDEKTKLETPYVPHQITGHE
ncbi:MAG: aldo/keto reductase, partial [Salinisphaera sp.]|uniref:aldo/keto reductase n=1 Tax=Salinisphaera sp. TaxID=1914330 RepID=UPI003C7B8720